jgi:dimethylargininase
VYAGMAVLANPGAESRRAEVAGTADALEELGYAIVEIEPPGTLDGGDVLKHGGDVWVGVGGRTNEEGARQLREHLAPLGARVVTVPQTRVLHLKSAVTALPDGTVVGHPPLVQDPSVWGERFLAVPEESGAHVVLLGGDRVLMAADAPGSAQIFRDRGLEVVEVDISEYEKLEGCVTCLSVRLRGLPG